MLRILLMLGVVFSGGVLAQATSEGDYYVSANRLSVRLGPSTAATITNTLSKNQRVEVLEVKNGWARLSRYYSGATEGKQGIVARWVSAKYLSSSKAEETTSNKTPLEKAIKGSDDYLTYRKNLIELSQKLIDKGQCSITDYKEMGGWLRSSTHKPKPIYFTYCGGFASGRKIYINAKTAELL